MLEVPTDYDEFMAHLAGMKGDEGERLCRGLRFFTEVDKYKAMVLSSFFSLEGGLGRGMMEVRARAVYRAVYRST
jgi:hypothetical protein